MPTYSENKFGVVQFGLLEEPSLVTKASGYRNQDRMSSGPTLDMNLCNFEPVNTLSPIQLIGLLLWGK